VQHRIPISELRTGMYVRRLGSSWLHHPFLRGSFLLTDPADITAIVEAGIQEVWIDPRKGAVPGPAGARQEGSQTPTSELVDEPTSSARGRVDTHSGKGVSMASEVVRAQKICQAAKSQIMEMFDEARLGKAIDPNTTLPLVDEITASVRRQPAALISVARLKNHDDYTYLHSVAVCALMLTLARQLGLDTHETRMAGLGGLMHDLGKAALPIEILNKPDRLTEAEFTIVRAHPLAGAQMLAAGNAAPEVQDIALHHHERVNGRGYPHALSGDQISRLARMAAICDVYDAVTSNRAYKAPWNPAGAMRQMAQWEGHFDKAIFNAFVKSVGIYPVGALVRLTSKRLAVIVEPGTDSLLKPKVRVFFSLRANEPIALQIVDLSAADCNDSIVGPEDPGQWKFSNLDDLWRP
jgi:putative nucleotidyltransferase with HDIG domain